MSDPRAGSPSASSDGPPPGCPMHASGQPSEYRAGDLTYNDYLKVQELLRLQVPQSDPAHHDEMLFIVIHQAYELWFKLILHEMEIAIRHMEAGETLRAHHFVKRIVAIMRLLVDQIHILETMAPVDFLEFRGRLMPASGFQSMQFREIEFLAGLKDPRYFDHFRDRPDLTVKLRERMEGADLFSAYLVLLRRHGFAIPPAPAGAAGRPDGQGEAAEAWQREVAGAVLPIYQTPSAHFPFYLLSEALVDFDEGLSLWREHHVRVVERVIGFKRGTGGSSGVGYLRSTTAKKCFPALWEVRTLLVPVTEPGGAETLP